jgi:copper(I)-binding protein
MKKIWIVVLIVSWLVYACQPQDKGIEVQDYWLRSAAQGGNSAMYMVISNNLADRDELVGGSSSIAEAVEIHETVMDSNGVMQMSPVSSLPLEPGTEVVFEPGGLHVMFIGLKQDLKVGDMVEVTLQFKEHEDIILSVPVLEDGEKMNH